MKKYRVALTPEERAELQALISRGKAAARKLTHARILLQADEAEGAPACTDEAIAAHLNAGVATVERIRERFVEQGLEAALNPAPAQRAYKCTLDGELQAHLIALACSTPPEGYKRWSLRLLADRMVELEHVDALSYETVRQTLKKTN